MASTRLSVLTRSFSTSGPVHQMVKPKVQVFGIDGRYAMALYSAASKKNALAAVEKDLNTFVSLIKTDGTFREFIMNPLLSKDLKKSAFTDVVKKKSGNAMTVNLLACMTDNGRVQHIEGVASAFGTIMAAERGEVICEVTTAKELDAASKKELDNVLKGFIKKGESIKLNINVDPSIIGGMIVSVGDRYVDMSIGTKIKKYTELIQAAV